jgi:hypothetical protein
MVTDTNYRLITVFDSTGKIFNQSGILTVTVKGSSDLAIRFTKNIAEALGISYLTRYMIESVIRVSEGEYEVKATWGSAPFPG